MSSRRRRRHSSKIRTCRDNSVRIHDLRWANQTISLRCSMRRVEACRYRFPACTLSSCPHAFFCHNRHACTMVQLSQTLVTPDRYPRTTSSSHSLSERYPRWWSFSDSQRLFRDAPIRRIPLQNIQYCTEYTHTITPGFV